MAYHHTEEKRKENASRKQINTDQAGLQVVNWCAGAPL